MNQKESAKQVKVFGRFNEHMTLLYNSDLPDPELVYYKGTYYLYGTQSNTCSDYAIHCAKSKNLRTWTKLKTAFRSVPKWADQSTDFWAPQVIKIGEQYHLYYSAKRNGTNNMAIGVAIGDTPEQFTDIGRPLLTGNEWDSIDPFVFRDPISHQLFLFYGSQHKPIRSVRLAMCGTRLLDANVFAVIKPEQKPYRKLLEGFCLIYHPQLKKYFAFVSGDDTRHSYAVTVYVAKHPLGPYRPILRNNGILLESTRSVLLPGQNTIFRDQQNNYWIVYHAVDATAPTETFTRKVYMQKLKFDGGVPQLV